MSSARWGIFSDHGRDLGRSDMLGSHQERLQQGPARLLPDAVRDAPCAWGAEGRQG